MILLQIIRFMIFVISFSRYVESAFLEAYSCNIDDSNYELEPFLIDVVLDESHKKMKFFINSKVSSLLNRNNTDIIIEDVNVTTNRYATLHVEIRFMGKTFINENKRFCNMIAVKNTTNYQGTPRYNATHPQSSSTASTVGGDSPHIPDGRVNTSINSKRKRNAQIDSEGNDISLANSNYTAETIFSNSTGDLVQCPLYSEDSFLLYYEADVSQHFHRLGSYTARFSVVSNDGASYVIGCNKVYVTPVQSDYISNTLMIGILVLLLTTAIVNFFTIIYSSYQESSNPFLFTASTICNENLLKQLDATVPRIIVYLQFALFISGLDLQYPGFYQPLIGKIRWCALMGFTILDSNSIKKTPERDNIYITIGSGGLRRLAFYSNLHSAQDSWPNFIICLLVWLSLSIVAQQLFLWVKRFIDWLIKKYNRTKLSLLNDENSKYEFISSNNGYFILGQILNNFFILFGLPFLVLTSFMFFNAGNLNANNKYFPNLYNLRINAFAYNVSYDGMLSSTYSSTTKLTSKVNTDYSLHSRHFDETSNFTGKNNFTVTKLTDKFIGVAMPSIISGSLLFTLWIILAFYFVFNFIITIKNFNFAINKNISKLYTSMKTILLWAFLYHYYSPDKVFFVIIDLVSLLAKSLIIGCLQNNGIIQVICLIIIEFIYLLLLFTIRPYFVKINWATTRWILPVARFLVTLLCIPYIRDLDLTEETRTYVAYVQLLIHVVVAIVFIIQLLYCLVITVLSILKNNNERRQYAKYSNKLKNLNSMDDFTREFEYHPVSNSVQLSTNDDDTKNKSNNCDNTQIAEDDDDEDLYYRAKSEMRLQSISHERNEKSIKCTIKRDFSNLTLFTNRNDAMALNNELMIPDLSSNSSQVDLYSFTKQQQFSNIRKKQNDYTFREGDLIYKKYFLDDSIDPEVKALWDSRNNWIAETLTDNQSPPNYLKHNNKDSFSSFGGIKNTIKSILGSNTSQPVEEKGFQVSRPRQLVVKPLSEIQNQIVSKTGNPASSRKTTSNHGPFSNHSSLNAIP